MPDSPSGGDYDWLYGDSHASKPAPPSSRRAASDLPPPNLPPPSGRRQKASPPPREPRGPRRRGRLRWLKVLLIAWLAFLVAVPVWAWSTIGRIDAEPDGDRPAEQPGTTYLLVGSDSREGLTKEQREELSTGNAGGQRTDTIMLLHVGSGPSLLLSIPRDSLVDVPGAGRTKINAAYAFGGAELLVQTVEQNTGIRVDDYVEVGFGGLVNVVDALGGVEICPKEDLKDKDSGLDVQKGCQEADGKTALAYSRNRHSYATQDIQRVQSQREVIGAIGVEAKSPWTVVNPLRYFRVGSSAAGSLVIGENVGPISLARFALALSGSMSGDGLNCTVPLQDFAVNWDGERAPALFELIQADRTADVGDLCTADGLPKG